uniref:Uncharacterized protein n=1 Tax=Hucho hucho TaxID=62062 RepID=A0A4W5PY62_9TELE
MNMYGDLVMDTVPEESRTKGSDGVKQCTENLSYPWGNFLCMLSSVCLFVCLNVGMQNNDSNCGGFVLQVG